MLVDLSRLPPPNVVEEISFEAILTERKERFVGLYPEEAQDAVRQTLALESEPIVKQLRESAYREMILRQRINEASRASLLAYATGEDLENRAADYGVERILIAPAEHDAVPLLPRYGKTTKGCVIVARWLWRGFRLQGVVEPISFTPCQRRQISPMFRLTRQLFNCQCVARRTRAAAHRCHRAGLHLRCRACQSDAW